jgi:hypothetical protein
MMLPLIYFIAFFSTITPAAEVASEVGQVIDLLIPGPDNPQLKRACMLQFDGNNVPCDAVRYVGFKDGAQSIQFNKGSGHNLTVSFFGKHRDIDIMLHRVIEWVDFGPIFESPGCFCCCRCGHVGNALALSIMSTAVPLVWT